MANIKVRYLTCRHGRPGELPRWFWQPSTALRMEGWAVQRVPDNWASFTDPDALLAAAIARANELNAEMDASRFSAALRETRLEVPLSQRTVGELIAAYRASKKYTALAPATQRGYRQCLDRIEKWAGDAPVRAIDARRVQKLHESFAATPAFANAIVRVLRLLLEFGRRGGWVQHNPATRPDLPGTEPTGLVWPAEAVAHLVATADAMGRQSVGDAVLLNEWLGQREGDILRMPRTVLRGDSLVLRQSKTGAGVALPIGMVPHLAARLAAALARTAEMDPLPSTIIVSEDTNRPYKSDNFRKVFARVRARAAKARPDFEVDHLMPGRDMADPDAFKVMTMDLTFMALRHTAVTRLAEAECDVQLIAAISGHAQATVLSIIERYMVRTTKMARLAFGKRMEAEGIGAPADGGFDIRERPLNGR
jgi:integrase